MRLSAAIICLLILAIPAKVFACSPPIDLAASYRQVEADFTSVLTGDDVVIALVKASVLSKKDPESDPLKLPIAPEDRKLLNMEINVERYIKGSGLSSIQVQYPKMLKFKRDREVEAARKVPAFGFWEGLLLSYPSSGWYGGETSCGPFFVKTMAQDQFYLAIGSSLGWRYFEPVSGPDHPLVSDIRRIVEGQEPNKLVREPADFFKHIDGYTEIEFTSCPEFEETYYGTIRGSSWDKPGESFKKYITVGDDFNGKPIELGDFYSHETGSGMWHPELCRVGDRYLVLHEMIGTPSHVYASSGSSMMALLSAPDDRYVKIKNEYVNIRDVKSQIKILGPELLPVQYLKEWIKGAATK